MSDDWKSHDFQTGTVKTFEHRYIEFIVKCAVTTYYTRETWTNISFLHAVASILRFPNTERQLLLITAALFLCGSWTYCLFCSVRWTMPPGYSSVVERTSAFSLRFVLYILIPVCYATFTAAISCFT